MNDQAHARRTDPGTSHEAAASITSEKLRKSQAQVLDLFSSWEGSAATDEELVWCAKAFNVVQSPSGIRTRRKELVDKGLVYDTGKKRRLESGRRAIVWKVR